MKKGITYVMSMILLSMLCILILLMYCNMAGPLQITWK